MRRGWMIAVPLFAITLTSSAQTNTPSKSQVTLKARALTVIVDVVATDRNGNPVTGLTKDRFHVLENGKPQQVSFFEAHHEVNPLSQIKPRTPLPENVYTNLPDISTANSTNVLLMDALNTPLENQVYVRQQMLAFLKQIPVETQLAIFTLSSQLRMLQGFSADPKILQEALNKKESFTNQPSLLPEQLEKRLSTIIEDTRDISKNPRIKEEVARIQQFEADIQATQTDLRVAYTLQAFRQLSAYLSGIPGRKNIIWFSGSFPIIVDPDSSLPQPFSITREYADAIRQTTNLLAANQISVYPVDGRGLMISPLFSVSRNGARYFAKSSAFNDENEKFFAQTTAENATMNQIAQSTGGKAFLNTNDLKDAIAQAIRLGSNYYTVAYTPTDSKYDGRYRKITVQVDSPDTALSYRRGYFAEDPNKPQQSSSSAGKLGLVQASMRRGVPDATQIIFNARVRSSDRQPDLANASTDNGTKSKVPLVHYSVDWAIDIHHVSTTATPDGLHHGSLLISLVAFDAEGKPINSQTKDLNLTLPQDLYTTVLQKGLPYHSDLDLPKAEGFLRLGVFDPSSSKAGTIELPFTAGNSGQQ